MGISWPIFLRSRRSSRYGRGPGWLGKTAVPRVLVFTTAGRTHLEARHRGQRPVVRQVANDREPRAAVCAVGEGVAESPVGGIEHLAPAVGAGGEIRRDRNLALDGAGAGHDREVARRRRGRDGGRAQSLDRRCGRRGGLEPTQEASDRIRRPVGFDDGIHARIRGIEWSIAGLPVGSLSSSTRPTTRTYISPVRSWNSRNVGPSAFWLRGPSPWSGTSGLYVITHEAVVATEWSPRPRVGVG